MANVSSEKFMGARKKGGLNRSIQNIADSVSNISETLKARHQWEKDQLKLTAQGAQTKKRNLKENLIESFKGVTTTAKKVLAPVQGILDKIIDVIKKLVLGKVAMDLYEWFSDKKNQGKLDSIMRFVKDWWPSMLGAYLLFGNSFTRFVAQIMLKVGVWVATSIPKMIAALAAALTKLKAMKWLKVLLGGGRGLKAFKLATVVGGGVLLTERLNDETRFDDGQPPPEDKNPEQNLATGGFVSGPAGVDRVPAKLTAGEFVMSKGAVNKWGTDTLAGMNAMGGGTNNPTGGRYNTGGLVEAKSDHKVTSPMGDRDSAMSPGDHLGVDIAAREGEKLSAFSDGVVAATGTGEGYGNWINWIDDKTGYGNFYAHMKDAALFKPGDILKKGDLLGYVGSTGNSTGPHLHWEVAKNPQDTGRPKNNILSRINPLMMYGKESPFGGTRRSSGNVSSGNVSSGNLGNRLSGKNRVNAITPLQAGSRITPPLSKRTGGVSATAMNSGTSVSGSRPIAGSKIPRFSAEKITSNRSNKIKTLGMSV